VLPIQGFLPTVNNREYDLFPNGKSLLMVVPATRTDTGAPVPTSIYTVLNWTEELNARVPTKLR
jgi:hypothetical protein